MPSTILDLGGNKELLLGARVLALDPIMVPGAPSAAFAGVPGTGTVGIAITGVSVTVANGPLYGVWVLGGIEQGARVQLANGANAIAIFTPSSAGSLVFAVFAASTGGGAIATSGVVAIAGSPGLSATFAGVPANATVGIAITGVSVTVTNGPGYGVWVLAGVEQGARVQLVNGGNAIASFTPGSAGGLDYALYSAATGGTPIATSSSVTVAASSPGGAQTASNVPANQPWYVTVGLSGYVRQPYFYVGLNGGPPTSLPQSAVTFTPSTGNPTSAVVRMPGQAPGTYTFLLLTDQGDRVTINATMVLVPHIDFGNVPQGGQVGSAISGVTFTATVVTSAWAAITLNGVEDTSVARVALSGASGTVPNIIPAHADNTASLIAFDAATGGNQIGQSVGTIKVLGANGGATIPGNVLITVIQQPSVATNGGNAQMIFTATNPDGTLLGGTPTINFTIPQGGDPNTFTPYVRNCGQYNSPWDGKTFITNGGYVTYNGLDGANGSNIQIWMKMDTQTVWTAIGNTFNA